MIRVSWKNWNGKDSRHTGMVLAWLPGDRPGQYPVAIVMHDTTKLVHYVTIGPSDELTVIGQRQRIVIEGDA